MEALNASNLFSVKDMVAVITGGGTGIGLMMTKTLAANGAKKIYIVGRRLEKLTEAVQFAPDIITPLQADVTSKTDLLSIADKVRTESGYINLLICNSGIMGPNVPAQANEVGLAEYAKGAFESGFEEFVRTQETNVAAPLWTAYADLELLGKGNESGFLGNEVKSSIIVTSSIASFSRVPGSGMAYKTSKAAASSLAKNMSSTFAPYDIRANAIAPGLFQSDLASGLINKGHGDRSKQSHEEGAFDRENIPLRRTGREQEMGGTILYLCSRAGGYCSGTVLVIDGGRLNIMPGA